MRSQRRLTWRKVKSGTSFLLWETEFKSAVNEADIMGECSGELDRDGTSSGLTAEEHAAGGGLAEVDGKISCLRLCILFISLAMLADILSAIRKILTKNFIAIAMSTSSLSQSQIDPAVTTSSNHQK